MNTYQLIDSGDFQKLEQIGEYRVIRPSLNSPYKKTDSALWKNIDAEYIKSDKGGGEWKYYNKIPNSYTIEFSSMQFLIKLTPFGHIGLFPEQADNWNLIRSIGKSKKNLEVLNLFAYSGASTIAALQAGMSVCHVDSSSGMVEWASDNVKLNHLDDKKIRWIVDDVVKFLKREIKRGKKYNGFVLDPPSFGRGAKGEIWKIERDLIELMETLMQLSDNAPEFIILSCHTTGYSPIALERILHSMISRSGKFYSTELHINEKFKSKMPGGFSSYYLSE